MKELYKNSTGLDALFERSWSENAVIPLRINKLYPFAGHPFKVRDDADMEELMESIRTHGVLTPLLVRPAKPGTFEVISGHRRLHACKKLGIETVPTLICTMEREDAIIALVDSNLHREKLRPSEKAFAYKMKLEAIKHQGKKTSSQVATKSGKQDSASVIGSQSGESSDVVFRYIRLTYLAKPILDLVDEGRIAFSPGVELSYLTKLEQAELWDIMQSEDCTPSLSQSVRLKKLSQKGELNPERIYEIMSEEKANQKERVRIEVSRIRKYFPRGYTSQQMEEKILQMLEANYKKRQPSQDGR